MKKQSSGKFVLLLVFLTWPAIVAAQSTLNFPRALSAAERGSTGFAILNPGGATAMANFTLYDSSGAAAATTSRQIPARGQLSRLASELFASSAPKGWVQVTSTTSGLQGFWLGGDFATYTDGAAAAEAYIDHLLPVVGNSEINIANSSVGSVAATIFAFDANGNQLATAFQALPPKAFMQSSLSGLFSPQVVAQTTHLRISCSTPFATTVVFKDSLAPQSWGVINGVDAGVFVDELRFPHVVSGEIGGANYSTLLNVANLSNEPQVVTFRFTPDGASSPSATASIQVAGNGTIRLSATGLFGFAGNVFRNGWVKVEGQSGLTGFAAYSDVFKRGSAVVPAPPAPGVQMMFAHIADLDPWWTGLALLNDSGSTAEVQVFAMEPGGSLIGGPQNVATAQFSVPPGQKVARLLREWIPQTHGRPSDGGFVFVRTTNGVPLYGMQLFGNVNASILANVSGRPIAAGSFTPPGP